MFLVFAKPVLFLASLSFVFQIILNIDYFQIKRIFRTPRNWTILHFFQYLPSEFELILAVPPVCAIFIRNALSNVVKPPYFYNSSVHTETASSFPCIRRCQQRVLHMKILVGVVVSSDRVLFWQHSIAISDCAIFRKEVSLNHFFLIRCFKEKGNFSQHFIFDVPPPKHMAPLEMARHFEFTDIPVCDVFLFEQILKPSGSGPRLGWGANGGCQYLTRLKICWWLMAVLWCFVSNLPSVAVF